MLKRKVAPARTLQVGGAKPVKNRKKESETGLMSEAIGKPTNEANKTERRKAVQ
jgi:hypothetical protein